METETVKTAFNVWMAILPFCCLVSIGLMCYGITIVFRHWELLKFDIQFCTLKEMVMIETPNKKNFSRIEAEFALIKCHEAQQSKVTALWNFFLQRFDKVNKYKKKVTEKVAWEDTFKIRIENRINQFMEELNNLHNMEETALSEKNRALYVNLLDKEEGINEKLQELKNILNIKS
jgi:hypothetical protein